MLTCNSSFQAKGKIIVYNQPYISYGVTVQYRSNGAVEAAKVGGVAEEKEQRLVGSESG
jgi:carboxypeptidase Q